LERQLGQAQKIEALGRMAGGIAHDFNNLLTVINSWSELLLDDCPPEGTVRRGLTQIKEAGDKAADLTRQLLAFTRHQVVEQQIMNLNERVMSIVELMKRVMPGMGGSVLAERLRQLRPGIKVIVTSGYAGGAATSLSYA
jgi:signal transduction histidine kinase